MWWLNFFFGFRGRIGRLQFHLGALVPALLYIPAGIDVWRRGKLALAMGSGQISATDLATLAPSTGTATWSMLALVALYMMLTLNAKRLHDIGKSGWLQCTAFLGLPVAIPGMFMLIVPGMSGIGLALCLVSFALSMWGLWIVIQIWFFAGQPGSNPFGPPPGNAAAAEYLAGEIEALEAATRPAAARTSSSAPATAGSPAARPVRQPSVQAARPAGFGRRNPRMA